MNRPPAGNEKVCCCDETAINEGKSSRRERAIDGSPVWVNPLVQGRPRATYGLDLGFRDLKRYLYFADTPWTR